MDFLKALVWIVVSLALFVRTISAVCEEEVLTTGTPKHDPPHEKITFSASTNYPELLHGDILTFESEFDFAFIGVYDKESPIKFADRSLTEVSFSVSGEVTRVGVYYTVENQRGLIELYDEQVTMPETGSKRVTVKLDELSAYSLAVQLYKPAGGVASISDMVLKACKKPEPVCEEVVCKSKERVYKECTIAKANEIVSAEIIEDYMRRPCYYHDNPPPGNYQQKDPGYFGYKGNILWVDHGCRALFKVCYF